VTTRPALRGETWLTSEYPELGRSVPWLPLAHVPTPVEPCDAISDWLGRGGVWFKRDDLISPVYGGNKVRRYEHVLAEARARGAERLVTAGGFGSTQVLATILLGRSLGFEVSAALFDQPATRFARNAMLAGAAAGGELIHGGGYLMTAIRTALAYRRAARPYLILPGASNPMANLGYVDAMLELDQQVRRGELPRPDVILVAAGSSGTMVGLSVGAALLGWPTTIVGVRITDLIACNRATVGFLIGATARYLAKRSRGLARAARREARFELDHRAIGGGYGHPTPEAIEAVEQVQRLTGAPGEVTYTAKALVALKALCREQPTSNILYWHTLSNTQPAADVSARDRLPPSLRHHLEGDVPV
jgi:D-cysteine desulfhydrase